MEKKLDRSGVLITGGFKDLVHEIAQLTEMAGCSPMLKGTVKPMCSSPRSGSLVGEGHSAGAGALGETGEIR